MTEHRFGELVWKPDGHTPTHRARCSCGWISTTAEVGYGSLLGHWDDHARHVREATCSRAPLLPGLREDFRAHLQTEWRHRQNIYEAHEWTAGPDGEDECAFCLVTWEEAGEECKR